MYLLMVNIDIVINKDTGLQFSCHFKKHFCRTTI